MQDWQKAWIEKLPTYKAGDMVTTDAVMALVIALWYGWGKWEDREGYLNFAKEGPLNEAVAHLKELV